MRPPRAVPLVALVARTVYASDLPAPVPVVTSETSAQFYDLRSPTGETVLTRRRVTSTLGLSLQDLAGAPSTPHDAQLSFHARLRYDADYGQNAHELDPSQRDSVVPGLSYDGVDLLYGYLEGRRFLRGWVGFKLGRQYVVDGLGWWSFDGALVRITSPVFVAAEAYAGFEVRGGLPLSSSRFEADGVWRGNRTGFDPALYPSFQPSSPAPAMGVALESTGLSWLHARVGYRRVLNTGPSTVAPFAGGKTTYDAARISQERFGASAEVLASDKAALKTRVNYDLYAARVTSIQGGLDLFLATRASLGLDYEYYRPFFDADSIWNFFMTQSWHDLGLRASFDASDRVSFASRVFGRLFGEDTWDGGGDLSVRYRRGDASVGVRGSGSTGWAGTRAGTDVVAERVLETRYVFSARGSLWRWEDSLRPDRAATSVGYVAGIGYRFAKGSQAMAEWEHNMNRLVGHRFRLLFWLAVAVLP
ncbi:MAG: hypothetical protein WCI05_08750 [Myxococcales bacterium]